MNLEKRLIKAAILTGVTDIVFGLLMFFTGWQNWYYNHFHNFGIFGFSMIAYGYWHLFFYRREGGDLWKK